MTDLDSWLLDVGVLPALLDVVERVGDPSLVPALARAATEDPSLAEPCARAYAAIARRHRLRRTSAALRKVRPEHRPALEAFLAARRRHCSRRSSRPWSTAIA